MMKFYHLNDEIRWLLDDEYNDEVLWFKWWNQMLDDEYNDEISWFKGYNLIISNYNN